jgi:hypothetical protein
VTKEEEEEILLCFRIKIEEEEKKLSTEKIRILIYKFKSTSPYVLM